MRPLQLSRIGIYLTSTWFWKRSKPKAFLSFSFHFFRSVHTTMKPVRWLLCGLAVDPAAFQSLVIKLLLWLFPCITSWKGTCHGLENKVDDTLEVGGKRFCKDRASQPSGRFVPSVCACVCAVLLNNNIHGLSISPFPLCARGHSPFPPGFVRVSLFEQI